MHPRGKNYYRVRQQRSGLLLAAAAAASSSEQPAASSGPNGSKQRSEWQEQPEAAQ